MELFNRGPAIGYRLVLLAIITFAVMMMDHRKHHLDSVRDVLSVTVSPVQRLVSWPVEFVDWARTNLTSYQTLVKENARLKAQLLILNAQLQKSSSLENENQRLHELLGSQERSGERMMTASLLSVDSAPYLHQFTLGKGSRDKVFQGQAVLDAHGVMGQVIQVSLTTSQVLLLNDTRSALPVEVSRTGLRSIAVGKGPTQPLSLIDVPKTEGIKVGDLIVTSGLGERFPPGYPVGVVRSVNFDPSEHFATIQVDPSAEFDRSRLVLLVWPRNTEKTTDSAERK